MPTRCEAITELLADAPQDELCACGGGDRRDAVVACASLALLAEKLSERLKGFAPHSETRRLQEIASQAATLAERLHRDFTLSLDDAEKVYFKLSDPVLASLDLYAETRKPRAVE